jgi:hypothetical protein
MLFANSDNDRIFPMGANRRIIDRLRKLYKLYDKSDLVDDYVSKGGHDYRPDLRLAIFRWINKHLKGDTTAIKDATDKPLPGKQLRVFPEDSDIPKDAINGSADETFVPVASVKLPGEGEFAEWKKRLLERLRQQCFHAPERAGADGKRILPLVSPRALPETGAGSKSGVLIVLDEGVAAGDKVPEWAKGLVGDAEVRLFSPRGSDPKMRWTTKSPPNYVARSHALLGRTVDQGRVYDVAEVVRRIGKGRTWTVIGRGQSGILAGYAALLEPTITGVIVVDPPASHRDGPHFLGVQRVLDIPEALGLLAPRPLVLVGAKDRAFDRTIQIYKAAGATDKVTRK